MRISDLSSDVCSSDLAVTPGWRTLPGIRIANGSHLQAPIEADRDRRGGGRMNPIDRSDGILVALEYSCVTFKNPIKKRSEERRVGKECVSTCRSRWPPDHYKKKTTINTKR